MRYLAAFLIFVQSARATVLIQGPGTPDFDYRAALKADPDLLSPVQTLVRQRPSPIQRETLLSGFASAQKAFLENSPQEAQALFESVVAMISADDWSRADRQIFLHSYLRLAQLQTLLEKQNYWLNRALAAGDDVEPEAGLFPPPLLHALKKIRADVPRAVVQENLFREGWTMILFNGIPCTKQNCPGLPLTGEKMRVTFLSNVWQSVSLYLDSTELKSVSVKKIAWIGGDCAKTQFSPASLALKEPEPFWGSNCASPNRSPDFKPIPPTDAIPRIEIKESSPAFYKSKWFWGGVVLAAAAAVIMNSQKREKEQREPTTTYGYQ